MNDCLCIEEVEEIVNKVETYSNEDLIKEMISLNLNILKLNEKIKEKEDNENKVINYLENKRMTKKALVDIDIVKSFLNGKEK